MKQASKIPTWKSAGPDGLQGYWIKNMKSTGGKKLPEFYNKCLQNDTVPTWMKRAQTTLAMKDKNKGAMSQTTDGLEHAYPCHENY